MKLYKRHTRILAITNADDTRWGFRHAHLKTIDGERYHVAVHQVQFNVVREPKAKKRGTKQ